jgi:hypothetical protein
MDTFTFQPPRQIGYLFHIVAIALLTGGAIWGLWQAIRIPIGLLFLLYLLPALFAITIVPLLAYRLYSLRASVYTLERDSITLQWGLRSHTIPMNHVLWVRPTSDLEVPLHLPWLRWPGAILGARRLRTGVPVEFLAARLRGMLLIATNERVYAVSPEDQNAFLQAFQHLTELGSLSPVQPQSIRPTSLIGQVWQTSTARYLVLSGALLSLGLFIWVSLVVPSLDQVSLGFTASGEPREPIQGIRLMLLPILNTLYFGVNLSLGLFFYRREESHPLAYLLWSNTILASALFIIAVHFILNI